MNVHNELFFLLLTRITELLAILSVTHIKRKFICKYSTIKMRQLQLSTDQGYCRQCSVSLLRVF